MRRIKKVAVLGSGVMGSGIACHLANAGLEVLMLDILPGDLEQKATGTTKFRNAVADKALQKAIKSKPAPLFVRSYASRISTGNFEDDFEKIKDCDWIIEVVIEKLEIKKQIFEKVDALRTAGTLVSSNTSGIPIHLMLEGRSDDFQTHFCGTHFFNPPRYLRLMEVIPTEKTAQSVIDFFMEFGDLVLGKTTVLAKDTPGFIANRIGVYSMAKIYKLTEELGLSLDEADKLTGPALARPKTGTFRLGDLVGHDTAVKVIQGLRENCPDDEQVNTFSIPEYLKFLLDNNYLGNKSGQGFYKKEGRDEKGKSIYHQLNLKTLEYEPIEKSALKSLKTSRQIDEKPKRIKAVFNADDKGGTLVKQSMLGLFAYVSNRIPEITDTVYSIDDAMRAGYAWEYGPFEYWDIIGIKTGIQQAEEQGEKIASWVKEMVDAGHTAFYKREAGKKYYFDQHSKDYREVPGTEEYIILDNYRDKEPVHKTSETILHDLGHGVLCLEFTSKMNAIGEGILSGINDAIEIAEQGDWQGLVIGNNAQNFTVGANLMMIAMLAYEQDWDELNMAVNLFQQTTMRCRYSSIPVVAATQGYVFGGGCETIMHCDAATCAAESYIGLVEAGVGLIPGGGGTKEFAVRASDEYNKDGIQIPVLLERFKTIATAQVSTSAAEAYQLGFLKHYKDEIIMNTSRNISAAKAKVLELAKGYVQPIMREDITVLGRQGIASLYLAANELKLGKFASDHDITIAKKVAYVLSGGDLTGTRQVSEQYLLDIEREAFLQLCGEHKTMERIQHMLQTGKPLRN